MAQVGFEFLTWCCCMWVGRGVLKGSEWFFVAVMLHGVNGLLSY